MGLNDTPVANRIHIGFFGRRNAGKSSLVNAVAGQTVSVVSDVAGTTTDHVKKTKELPPRGPEVLIETPGYDDEGRLGEMRVARTKQILNRTDLAVLAVDGSVGMTACDYELLDIFRAKDIPFLIAFDKADLVQAEIPADLADAAVRVSAASGAGLHAFKERLAHLRPAEAARPLVADLVQPGDVAVLVIPIDEAAPKGRSSRCCASCSRSALWPSARASASLPPRWRRCAPTRRLWLRTVRRLPRLRPLCPSAYR